MGILFGFLFDSKEKKIKIISLICILLYYTGSLIAVFTIESKKYLADMICHN